MFLENFEWQSCCRVTKFEELVAVGDRFLIGFQQGLGKFSQELWLYLVTNEVSFHNFQYIYLNFHVEYLRRYPIDRKSELLGKIFETNETKRLRSYFEARCINIDDGVHNISKCKCNLSNTEPSSTSFFFFFFGWN